MATSRQLQGAPTMDGTKRRLTQAERTAISDRRMLEAAMSLVAERGTQNTTLREVGELAGYSRGLASNRFGSKEELFAELIDVFNKRWKNELTAFVGGKKGLDAFGAAIDSVIHYMKDNSEYIRAMFILYYETVGSNTVVRDRLAEQHGAYRRAISRYINQGIEAGTVKKTTVPGRVALQYTSFFFGLVYQWLANSEEVDFEIALNDFRDALFSLIVQPGRKDG